MKLIYRGRQMGKTTELIRQAATIPNSVIVVHSRQSALLLKLEAELGMGIKLDNNLLTYDDLLQGRHKGKIYSAMLIDNVDMLLQRIMGPTPIDTITINRHFYRSEEDTSED